LEQRRSDSQGSSFTQAGIEEPLVPESAFATYVGKPLAEKLGIITGCRVALIDTPHDFTALEGLPSGVEITSK
jgi:hypothetical protein